ncbi:hypothetical protein CEUSTIGMA_g3868.t1 [Chlamydomonas eustigma]|uniref:GrpE protein homolog n=1 Tax=Chlamydomonas eustigma TaxID=1157962 RepID=A0A250X019_9CHLO|nr:hypothetical protein CEUSTIGMA_g3868.t1 [Chlamydomonas eustigma]|eukprot:GAX76423.1 hypothetical protein CEUSTIGMA_g3868.t1 [Chlamydomonas eustigma]
MRLAEANHGNIRRKDYLKDSRTGITRKCISCRRSRVLFNLQEYKIYPVSNYLSSRVSTKPLRSFLSHRLPIVVTEPESLKQQLLQDLREATCWQDVQKLLHRYQGVHGTQTELWLLRQVLGSVPRLAPRRDNERAAFEQLISSLTGLARQHIAQCNPDDLADTVYRLGQLGALDPEFMEDVIAAARRQYSLRSDQPYDPEGLHNLLGAFASVRASPQYNSLDLLLQDSGLLLQCRTPEQLASVLIALSQLGYRGEHANGAFQEALERLCTSCVASMGNSSNDAMCFPLNRINRGYEVGTSSTPVAQPSTESVNQASAPLLYTNSPLTQPGWIYQQEEEEKVLKWRKKLVAEAQQVTATIRILERMGRMRQAQELRTAYLNRMRVQQQYMQQWKLAKLQDAQKEQAKKEQLLLQQQQQQGQGSFRRQVPSLSPPSAALQQALQVAGSWQQLQRLLTTYWPRLDYGNLVLAFSRLPQLLARSPPVSYIQRSEVAELLEALGSALAEGALAASPSQLTRCLESCSRLRYLDQGLLSTLLRAVRSSVDDFEGTELVGVLSALAATGLRPTGDFMQLILGAVLDQMEGMSSHSLRTLITSVLKLGVTPSDTWLLHFLDQVKSQEVSLEESGVTSCLKAAVLINEGLVRSWIQKESTRKAHADSTDDARRVQRLSVPESALPSAEHIFSPFLSRGSDGALANSAVKDGKPSGPVAESGKSYSQPFAVDKEAGSVASWSNEMKERVQEGTLVSSESYEDDVTPEEDIQVPVSLESVDFDYEQEASSLGPLMAGQQLPGGYTVPPPSLLSRQSEMAGSADDSSMDQQMLEDARMRRGDTDHAHDNAETMSARMGHDTNNSYQEGNSVSTAVPLDADEVLLDDNLGVDITEGLPWLNFEYFEEVDEEDDALESGNTLELSSLSSAPSTAASTIIEGGNTLEFSQLNTAPSTAASTIIEGGNTLEFSQLNSAPSTAASTINEGGNTLEFSQLVDSAPSAGASTVDVVASVVEQSVEVKVGDEVSSSTADQRQAAESISIASGPPDNATSHHLQEERGPSPSLSTPQSLLDTTSQNEEVNEVEEEDDKLPLELLRAAVQDRYEEVMQYMERERQAVQEMEQREEEARASIPLNMLYKLQKDFQNAMARSQKEKQEARGKAVAAVVEKVLPVLDNFERAAMSLRATTSQEALIKERYEEVQHLLVEILSKHGVKELECKGKHFDPLMHEAIMQEYSDEVPDGTVLMCLQKGYQLISPPVSSGTSDVSDAEDASISSRKGAEELHAGSRSRDIVDGKSHDLNLAVGNISNKPQLASERSDVISHPGLLIRPALVKVSTR